MLFELGDGLRDRRLRQKHMLGGLADAAPRHHLAEGAQMPQIGKFVFNVYIKILYEIGQIGMR